jgi:HEPN domain-containing protein
MQEHEKWLMYAKEDIDMAQLAMSPDHMMVRSALYHAQQCAEKSLKAFFIYKSKKIPPRTHDLAGLITLCSAFDEEFESFYKEAEDINPFSVSTRYPEDAYMYPDVDYTNKIIKKAADIFDFVQYKTK